MPPTRSESSLGLFNAAISVLGEYTREFRDAGISGTPTIVLDDTFDGLASRDAAKAIVEHAIGLARKGYSVNLMTHRPEIIALTGEDYFD